MGVDALCNKNSLLEARENLSVFNIPQNNVNDEL